MGNTLSVNLESLSAGTTYYGRARAYDAAANVSGNTATAAMATLNANYAALERAGQRHADKFRSEHLIHVVDALAGARQFLRLPFIRSSCPRSRHFPTLPATLGRAIFYQYPTRSVLLNGLKTGTVYYARVRANDAYGNTSNFSSSVPLASAVVGLGSSDFDASTLNAARVYPNPWRRDRHQGYDVTFDQLSLNSTVKIFTVAGHWVRTLDAAGGAAHWDLLTAGGDHAASGLYLYLITDGQGQTARGLFAVIR